MERPSLKLAIRTCGGRLGVIFWLASRVPLREGGLREALLAPTLKEVRAYAANWSTYGRGEGLEDQKRLYNARTQPHPSQRGAMRFSDKSARLGVRPIFSAALALAGVVGTIFGVEYSGWAGGAGIGFMLADFYSLWAEYQRVRAERDDAVSLATQLPSPPIIPSPPAVEPPPALADEE